MQDFLFNEEPPKEIKTGGKQHVDNSRIVHNGPGH